VATGAEILKRWPCAPDRWPFESKVSRFQHSVKEWLLLPYAKFQVIVISGFC